MDASHDHGDAALPEFARDFVRARCLEGHGGDADEIKMFLKVDLFCLLINNLYGVFWGCKRGERGKRQRDAECHPGVWPSRVQGAHEVR